MKRFLAIGLLILLAGCEHLESLGTMNDPGQASNVLAEFRNGQTFITWREVAGPNVKYNVYCDSTRFRTPEQLTKDRLLATVGDQTSLNLMASVSRIKFANLVPPAQLELEGRVYFSVANDMPPLTDDTGLYVKTATKFAPAFYAVTAVVNGAENRNLYATSDGNVTRNAVRERVQMVKPVKQNATDYVHWTSNEATRFYGAMSSVAGVPYNIRVHAPAAMGGKRPVIGILHSRLLQYNTGDQARYAKIDGPEGDAAIRVALDSPVFESRAKNGMVKSIAGIGPVEDWPLAYWHGYNSHFGTGKPLEQGKDVDYTVQRVLWTLDWAAKEFHGDENKISLRGEGMGGTGALQIGLTHPEKFAAIHAYAPSVSVDEERDLEQTLKTLRFNPPEYVLTNQSKHPPFIIITAGRGDAVAKWPWKKTFAKVLEQARMGFILYWDGRVHTYGNDPKFKPVWGEPQGLPVKSVAAFSTVQSYPAIAYLRANSDPGSVDFAVEPSRRPPLNVPGAGALIGTINGVVDWEPSSIMDQPGRYEITLYLNSLSDLTETQAHITPRRTQKFRAGEKGKVRYAFTDVATGTTRGGGEAVADENGLVQIPNVPITVGGTRLQIALR